MHGLQLQGLHSFVPALLVSHCVGSLIPPVDLHGRVVGIASSLRSDTISTALGFLNHVSNYYLIHWKTCRVVVVGYWMGLFGNFYSATKHDTTTQNQLYIYVLTSHMVHKLSKLIKISFFFWPFLQCAQNTKQFISADSPSWAEQNSTNNFVVASTVVELLRLRDTGRMDTRRCTHNRLIMYCDLWRRTALRYTIFLIWFRSSQARFHSNMGKKVISITFSRDWRELLVVSVTVSKILRSKHTRLRFWR